MISHVVAKLLSRLMPKRQGNLREVDQERLLPQADAVGSGRQKWRYCGTSWAGPSTKRLAWQVRAHRWDELKALSTTLVVPDSSTRRRFHREPKWPCGYPML